MAYTTIDKPSDYFNTVLYSGNGTAIGSGGQAITGVGFAPDWTWIKERSSTSPHKLLDTVRGATKELESSATSAEATTAESLASFDSDGFTVGSNGAVNENSQTYASWNWLAGGTASSNSDGSITSSVSANTTAGFSICSWTGNSGTIGHGLGVKPAVIWIKSRQTANNWVVLHKGLTGGMDANGIVLNDTAAETSGGSGMAEPTSSVFTITSGLAANDNNIGYVFAEKKGYSKFGSYTGNGNADGAFVYTGFRPAWIIVKRRGGVTNWQIQDSKRDGFNDQNKRILANVNEAEKTSQMWDQLSNGFKIRVTSENANGSGMSYIYMAFAEAPFVTAGTKAAGTAR
jgi:hypothetical protein